MTSRLLLGSLCATFSALGQATAPKDRSYDVVSVKLGIRGQPAGFHSSPGEFRLDNYVLPGIISTVFGMPLDRVIGLPAWTSSETFSFRARSAVPIDNAAEQWKLLAPVLEERFKLKYHREKRQMRVYDLSAASSGVQLPVTIPGTCKPIDPNDGAPTPSPNGSKRPPDPEAPRSCGRFLLQPLPEGGVRLSVKAITLAQLAQYFERFVDHPIVNRTGLTKLFDIDSLIFVKDSVTVGGTRLQSGQLVGDTRWQEAASASEATRPSTSSELPTIFAALKKVGLRLARSQGNVEVLVIDQLERPVQN